MELVVRKAGEQALAVVRPHPPQQRVQFQQQVVHATSSSHIQPRGRLLVAARRALSRARLAPTVDPSRWPGPGRSGAVGAPGAARLEEVRSAALDRLSRTEGGPGGVALT